MLYHLLYPLRDIFSPLNVFQYITFRTGGAILTSLVFCLVFGPPMIRKLRSLKISQTIRNDGPKTHLSKAGTPTMGGLLILLSMLISTLLWARLDNRFILFVIAGTICLGLLGFCDDYLKLVKKNPRGVSARAKLSVQTLFALGVAVYLWMDPSNPGFTTTINIPYLKNSFLNLHYFYFALVMFIVVGSSNAVNLTDGLDGLAIGNLIIAALALSLFAYFSGHMKIAGYLRIIPVPGAGELTVFLGTMIGAGLGFLWFNAHPAEVFMGDTGSLFLGGALGLVAVFIKQELILVVIGGVFVAEALSVITQVYSFRRTGKRIFRMAPLHHHFELSGWPESKVTIRFWVIGIVLALVAFASLKLR